jgi:hypothetical protein
MNISLFLYIIPVLFISVFICLINISFITGLKLYKHLSGFPLPQSDFIVPDEPQWPYWMYNMPLGEWSAIARIQQNMIAEYYPHRRDMLNALEFLWWIPPGSCISNKYYQPVE